MKKPSIIRAIHKLIKKNIVSKRANEHYNIYRFNKDFDTWQPLAKKLIVSKRANAVSKRANEPLAKELHTIDNVTKETNTKERETPAQISRNFFNNLETQEKLINQLKEKYNADYNFLKAEINKFILYWTEPNKSGTKQRWEQQQTFEITRRLTTWFGNINKFNKTQKSKITKIS